MFEVNEKVTITIELVERVNIASSIQVKIPFYTHRS